MTARPPPQCCAVFSSWPDWLLPYWLKHRNPRLLPENEPSRMSAFVVRPGQVIPRGTNRYQRRVDRRRRQRRRRSARSGCDRCQGADRVSRIHRRRSHRSDRQGQSSQTGRRQKGRLHASRPGRHASRQSPRTDTGIPRGLCRPKPTRMHSTRSANTASRHCTCSPTGANRQRSRRTDRGHRSS